MDEKQLSKVKNGDIIAKGSDLSQPLPGSENRYFSYRETFHTPPFFLLLNCPQGPRWNLGLFGSQISCRLLGELCPSDVVGAKTTLVF